MSRPEGALPRWIVYPTLALAALAGILFVVYSHLCLS